MRVECTIRDCVSDADVVCTMVGYPKDVEEIYEGDDGIFAHAKAHAVLIDFTTSSPALAKKLYTAAKAKGYAMLDAPVSGGDSGAKAASLSIMTGGDEEVFEQMRPLFSLLGTGIQYMGEAGSGQHTKACNQIAVAGAVAAMSEALVYARAVGLDEQKMLTAIAKGIPHRVFSQTTSLPAFISSILLRICTLFSRRWSSRTSIWICWRLSAICTKHWQAWERKTTVHRHLCIIINEYKSCDNLARILTPQLSIYHVYRTFTQSDLS